MIKNYFKIAWRSLLKNKLQTAINLLGLTIGTLCCLAILVHINAQLDYDTQHEDAASLYRVRTVIEGLGNTGAGFNSAGSSPPIAFALKEDFPEVEEACRVVYFGEGNEQLIRTSTSTSGYYEPRGYIADPTFFDLFNFPFVEGNNPGEALESPNTIVLSSSLSQKLFGKKPALNKTLVLGSGEGEQTLTVTGVFDENMGKSHLNPNYLLSMNSPGGIGELVRSVQNYATQNFVFSYVKLVPGADIRRLQQKLPEFLQNRGAKDLETAGMEKTIALQPVKDIHLYSKGITNQIDKVSNIQYLYVLLLLAFFIQLVACINFINLSTARASKRAKEIGVRKVVGADKGSLIRQFMSESVLISLFACFISIPIYLVLQPYINELTQGNVGVMDIFNIQIMLLLLGLGIITGLLAGAYPALIMSSIKPVRVLKGLVNLPSGNGNFRKALVVFQFVLSITLIASVIIVTQQLKYAQSKDMGFDKENVIAIRLGTDEIQRKFEALRTQLATVSGVSQVAGTNNYPSKPVLGDMGIYLPGGNPQDLTLVFYNGISPDYFETVNTALLTGRNLSANDSTQIVVNKATIDAFNIPLESAAGARLIQTYEGEEQEFEIVGVVQNYHFATLKTAIAPILNFVDNSPGWLVLKANTSDYKRLLANLEKVWKATEKSAPFVYTFIDKEVEKLYVEEQRLAKISVVFTTLAILISCLGLFGLVSFVAQQKKKEIGIRKVLGANVHTVVQLLTKDFLKLVVIAFVIAAPLAYFIMKNWLQDFQYRIDISWWVFVIAGLAALTITILTVSFQAIKAAIANPVKSLRTE